MNQQLDRLRTEQRWVQRLIANTRSKLSRASLLRRLEEINKAIDSARRPSGTQGVPRKDNS